MIFAQTGPFETKKSRITKFSELAIVSEMILVINMSHIFRKHLAWSETTAFVCKFHQRPES